MDKKALLEWYAAAGVDEAVDDVALNHYTKPVTPSLRGAEGDAAIQEESKQLDRHAPADDGNKTHLHSTPHTFRGGCRFA
jgi:hypothetical protein